MLITLLLLGGLYVVFVLALLAAGAGAVTMAVVLGVVAAAQLLFSERLALRAVGAHITTPDKRPACMPWSSACACSRACLSPR